MSKRFLLYVFGFLFLNIPINVLKAQCLQVNVEVIVEEWVNPCNGPITLDAHYPGYNHLWNTGATTNQIVVTKTDTYYVTVDDGFGCVGTDTIKVTFMDKPTLSLGADPAPQCGGCVNLSPSLSPGLDYLWSTGEKSDKIKYCKPGKNLVSLTVKNSVGCVASDTIEVTINPGLNVSLGPDISTCNDHVPLATGLTGVSHLWSTGETTDKIDVTQSGTYYVEVSDGTCGGIDTVNVTFLDKPTVDLGPNPSDKCGGCVQLNAGSAPGVTYLWNNGSTTNSTQICGAGDYEISVKVTNASKCSAYDTVKFKIKAGVPVNLGPDIFSCDEKVVLKSNLTGYSFLWNTGATSNNLLVNQSGTYSVFVSDGSCEGTDTIKVTLLPRPTVDLGSDPSDKCGGCVQLNAGNASGVNYLWNNGSTSNNTKICGAGDHEVSVKVTNSFNCSAYDTVNFKITAGIPVDLGPNISTCDDKVVLSSNLTGYSFLWNTGATSSDLLVDNSGTYSIFVTDGNCVGYDTVKVNFLPLPYVNLGADPDPRCGGCLSLSVTKSPGIDYIWSTGETTSSINYCKEGTNEVKVVAINSSGCKYTDTIKVTILSGFEFHLNNGKDTTVCKGPVTLEAKEIPGATYLWNTGSHSSSIQVNSPGLYFVDVYNLPGCSSKDTLRDTIAVAFNPTLDAPSTITDLSTCSMNKYSISPVSGATSYIWTVPQGATIVSGQGTTTIVVGSNGSLTGSLSVQSSNSSPTCSSDKQELEIAMGQPNLNIPNAFSPNNDGINDVWVIRNIQFYQDNELVVLNRWGNEVYRVKNYNSNWDGSSLNQGSYFYKLVLNECSGKKEYTGYITIVR